MATDTQIKTVNFYSRGRNERLIRQPKVRDLSAIGTQRTIQEGVRYEFAPEGRIEVYEGQDMLPDGPMAVNEATGRLEPTPQDAISWLRAHPLFNQRFWEEGAEPDRPLPTEEAFLDVVTTAVATMAPEDVEQLEAWLAQERSSHNRPVLLAAADGALRKIAQTRKALEAEQKTT
jgi:hypothetical protein